MRVFLLAMVSSVGVSAYIANPRKSFLRGRSGQKILVADAPFSVAASTDEGFMCGDDGVNPIDPETVTVGELNMDDPVCQKWKGPHTEKGNGDKVIPLLDLAKAWKAAGNNMKYCPEALVIGGGECGASKTLCKDPATGKTVICDPPTYKDLLPPQEQGCLWGATGDSGIWQVDSAMGFPGYDAYNPCQNAKAVVNHAIYNDDSGKYMGQYDPSCYHKVGDKTVHANMRQGIPAGKYNKPDGVAPFGEPTFPGISNVGGRNQKYYSYTGGDEEGNCNWLGPFCHTHTLRNDSDTCCSWTGGANNYQPEGYPYYYMKMFLAMAIGWDAYNADSSLTNCGLDFVFDEANPDKSAADAVLKVGSPAACKALAVRALQQAKEICDMV